MIFDLFEKFIKYNFIHVTIHRADPEVIFGKIFLNEKLIVGSAPCMFSGGDDYRSQMGQRTLTIFYNLLP